MSGCIDHPADVVFLIDSSSSVSEEEYENLKIRLSEQIHQILPSDTNLAVVQFSHFQQTIWGFHEKTSDEWSEGILEMEQLFGKFLNLVS